jgi:hypothetical protein
MSSASPAPSTAGASVYYRFNDAQGRLHIVDSLDKVPAPLRARAERIELVAPSRESTSWRTGTHWTSFGLGVGAALVLVLVFLSLRRGWSPLLKLGLVIGAIALLAGAYFGWIRRQSGQSDSVLASPSALIDDARKAVDQANRRNREQEEALKEIDRQAK